jgi:carbamoyltransferase
VCNGAGEVGPRALGHRSLLARPDDPALRRRVSEVVKRREWYRPVAPVLCAEVAAEALGPAVAASALSPFMLGAWKLRPGWRDRFRGVVHEDGSVRAQVVKPGDADNEWLYTLLLRLWREHGVFGLINTSFNVKGKPMLQRHEEAAAAARAMELDAVVVHGSLHRY